jgi:hypothetical protein
MVIVLRIVSPDDAAESVNGRAKTKGRGTIFLCRLR